MKPKLSEEMRAAVETAKSPGGGFLRRFPGGYWHGVTVEGVKSARWFGTSTVEALVKRGAMEYSEWRDGYRGRFPICATVKGGAS